MITKNIQLSYFNYLEEYLAFISEYTPKMKHYYQSRHYGKINIDGEMWEICPHGIGMRMTKIGENFEIDFNFLFDDSKKRYYYDKWKFHNFLENKNELLFGGNESERKKNYELCHNFFVNKNWIGEKKGLAGGYYISKLYSN